MSTTMTVGLINNAALLLALGLLYDTLLLRRRAPHSMVQQAVMGLMIGAIGLALMLNPWRLTNGLIFDTRSVLLSISGLFFGAVPTLLAMAMTGAYRFSLGGPGVWMGLSVIMTSGAIGIAWRHLRRRDLDRISWGELYLLGVVVHLAMLACMALLPGRLAYQALLQVGLVVVLGYPGMSIPLGRLMAARLTHSRGEEQLQAREREYRALAENTPDIIMRFDAAGRHLFVSPALRQVSDADPASFIGKTHRELGFPEDLCSYWEEALSAVFKSGLPSEREFEFLGKSGPVIFNWRLFPEYDDAGVIRSVLSIARDMTSHRKAERDYQMLFLDMVDGFSVHDIILDGDGTPVDYRFLAVNPAFETMTGLRAADILGRTVREVLPKIEPVWIENFGRVALTGEPAHFEDYVQEMNKYFEVLAYRPTPGQFACTFRDITDRKRIEHALRESEMRLRTLVERAPIPIFIQIEGRFDYLNEAALKTLGAASAQELLGQSVLDRFHPDFRQNVRDRIHAINDLRLDAPVVEETMLQLDGTAFDAEVSAVPFKLQERQGALAFFQDITGRKRAEQERLQMERQILQTQKLESLGVLAGGIAHDFNNILMAVLGHADLALVDLPQNLPARESLGEIEKAARRAADLCRQMLAYSGKGQFVIELIHLRDLIDDMIHLLKTTISKKALLNLHLEKNLPPLRGDATQIRQVIMNLVLNASEAIGERSGVITLSTGAMECSREYLASTYLDESLAEGLYVWLEVSDTGCGMDKETQSRLFEPFFTTKFTGRGLGMSAVMGIVRGHKGALKVYSEPGRGTTFKILFPAVEDDDAHERKLAATRDEWSSQGTILLVDDEETIRALGKKMVERLGFTVQVACDGREALERYLESRGEIDLVILDLTMPHMNGEETFRELRRINPEVRVILSSGYTEQDIVSRFAGKGLAGFIQKPYTLDALRNCLRKATAGLSSTEPDLPGSTPP